MRFENLSQFIKSDTLGRTKGPIAVILVEDLVEVDTTLRHHLLAGFETMLVFAPAELTLPDDLNQSIERITCDLSQAGATQNVVNTIIDAAPGRWIYYCYNAEFLFHPFCESRNISELLAFHTEERRDAMLGYVVDLYAGDLGQFPSAVSLDSAYLDKSGYYALGRITDTLTNQPNERQLNFYGGLRWRFEEHIPETRRRIDRIPLFKARPGLKLLADHTFNNEEYNTYSCPWHHNVTVAIASFRTAKALKSNSGSTFDIDTFHWHNSVEFDWNSQQLLDLGLMEPGQWF